MNRSGRRILARLLAALLPGFAPSFCAAQTAPAELPAAADAGLRPAPLEEGDVCLPISLAAALRLADARPLVVAAAQASAWVAEAQLQRATARRWLPELDLDITYLRHDGVGPDFNGGRNPPLNLSTQKLPIYNDINWFFAGGGLYLVGDVTDAVYAPLAARQVLDSRRHDIQSAKNDALLETAQAYFGVHMSRGRYVAALDCVERSGKLVERVRALSKDLVPKVEADRARQQLAELEQQAASAREEWRVASADLTRVLRLDPRAVVQPVERDHLRLTLVDPARPLDDLIPVGLTNRPELASQQALVQAALVRIRQEKSRPVLPTVLVSGLQTPADQHTQLGIFGTGFGDKMNNWSYRHDISVQLGWRLEGFGFGNAARVKEQRGEQSRALAELFRVQDEIAAEITEAQARAQSAAVRVGEAERGLRAAVITFAGNYEGLRQTERFDDLLVEVFRPQEAVAALTNLKAAYDRYFETAAEYNLAQFRLYHALGYPAQALTCSDALGEAAPADTSRPAYLPAAGTGPPPAGE